MFIRGERCCIQRKAPLSFGAEEGRSELNTKAILTNNIVGGKLSQVFSVGDSACLDSFEHSFDKDDRPVGCDVSPDIFYQPF